MAQKTPPPDVEELLTVVEVATLLRLTRQHVYTLIQRGEFGDTVHPGPQSTRITRSGYEAYLKRNQVARPAAS